jgi:hypothetical protein
VDPITGIIVGLAVLASLGAGLASVAPPPRSTV